MHNENLIAFIQKVYPIARPCVEEIASHFQGNSDLSNYQKLNEAAGLYIGTHIITCTFPAIIVAETRRTMG